ncbi:MAG: zinc metallopeptidase, partial [Oscillospiraceae bacterium]
MYFDKYYLFLVIPALIISMYAQFKVTSTYRKYKGVGLYKTAYDFARELLDKNGLYNVKIELISGELTDHFNPRTNTVSLSAGSSNSVSDIGVACHEVGHAIQHATNYKPLKVRAALVPITQIGSTIAIPLAFMGFFMGMELLVNIGIILFFTVCLFQLITLPVEFNASIRAVNYLENELNQNQL